MFLARYMYSIFFGSLSDGQNRLTHNKRLVEHPIVYQKGGNRKNKIRNLFLLIKYFTRLLTKAFLICKCVNSVSVVLAKRIMKIDDKRT